MNRLRILCFLDYYLPGFRGGGPLRTIANMVERVGGEFEFLIVTRDRDLNSETPYQDVAVGVWNCVGNAQVYYAAPAQLSLRNLAHLIRNTPHDIVYLNSFFSPRTTGLPLLIRWLRRDAGTPFILAPRGELFSGALSRRSGRKSAYLRLLRMLPLYDDLVWHASSDTEALVIRKTLAPIAREVVVAPDLLPRHGGAAAPAVEPRPEGPLRVIFLSRIVAHKNLAFLLEVLSGVRAAVQCSIYGPVEDAGYWARCQRTIEGLPANIVVEYRGEARPDDVHAVFAAHDVFVFPTRGENFGHVVVEAVKAGTAAILSDHTPWRADPAGGVEVLPLDDPGRWRAAIENWALFGSAEYRRRRAAAHAYAVRCVNDEYVLERNRRLFAEAGRAVRRRNAQATAGATKE